jgi:hypothetical protein
MPSFREAFDITPSDVGDVGEPLGLLLALTRAQDTFPGCAAIYVGDDGAAGAGDVTIETLNGTEITFEKVAPGTILEVWARKVLSTGTTATGLVGLNY